MLGWLFRQPELIFRVDQLLQQHDLATLAGDDFAYTDDQLVFGLIRQAVEQDAIDQHTFVVAVAAGIA